MQFIFAIVLALIVGCLYCPFAALLSAFALGLSILILLGILNVFSSGYNALTIAAKDSP